ncbi:MAG: acyltransferase domain-containing protein, partial [bacterium]|nr:acyltransferase domain-containing protein [bacterium]
MSDSAKFDPPEFSEGPEEGIAIVGMACRFPGSAGPEEFWTHLSAGVEGIARLSDEELLAAGVDPALLAHPNYVKAAPRLAGYDRFDAGFFGYNAMEAQVMDPQQRVLLECAWTALEHAGYDPARCDGTIGVYAGSKTNTYLFHLASNPEVLQAWDTLQLILGGDQAMLASRISYKFNLKGPSYGVQSACSTSLVAVHLACQGLLLDECQMAMAGGVAINVPHDEGYLYQEGGILSADGHCRPFDAAAGGTVFGSGVGVVVLKRLSDALDDGDRIWAVIRGSAINNDGSEKANFTAPSVEGQTDVILEALACAGVDAESISYLEAHGTGTSLGDPIEALALTDAYRAGTEKKGFCAIGSVKGNVGHLDAAAGMAGLIKTVLALEHQAIPPTLHFQAPNPKIDFENSPFRVQAELTDWKPGPQPRRAGLSSLGFGGTNAHLILQEPPPRKPSETSRSCQLLVLSARTPTALEKATANLARHLDAHPELDPADVAHTLQVGRRPFDHRRIAVCHDLGEAVEILDSVDGERVVTGQFQEGQQRFVFLFPGQGAQYAGMGQGLYETEATFRREVDRCCELLEPQLGTDLREVIPLGSGTHGRRRRTAPTAAVLEQTAITQPALFVVEYALAQLWASWGIRPQAMIGHSIGEYVAACLAGVFSLEDALALVATRGRLMQEMPGGAMLSVAAPEATLTPLLGEELSLAAVNAPKRCVASGPEEAVAVLAEALAERGVKTRRLHTSHAFHSPMMEPIIERFTEAVGRVTVQPPQIPFFSNLTGRRITDEEATDPTYWARHLRQAVRFADGLGEMLREPGALLLEVGPGTSLSTLARQHPARSGQLVASSLRHPGDQRSDSAFLLTTLGKLWIAGTDVDWTSFYARERRQRVPLPTYPFESKRYWIESPRAAGRVRPQLTLEKKADVGEWLYRSTWQPSPLTETPETKTKTKTKTKTAPWLVFSDAGRLGPGLVERLRQDGREVISVEAGESFATLSDDGYRIRPESPGDYEELFEALAANGAVPATIVHLWSVTGRRDELPAAELYELCQPLGFQSLLNLAQALGKRNLSEPVEIAVVSDGMQPVDGAAEVTAEKATLLGPCKVIPKEYPHLTCRSIDLAAGDEAPSEQLDQILAELTARPAERVVAYRGGDRWVEGFEPLTLDDETAGPGLRVEGVYLITGGLGGVGFVLAEALASELRARLVLTGRVELPERSAWEEWLASHDDDDAVAGKIRKVARLEELGAEVLVARADAADRERMAEVVAEARERFGTLHGAIHVAGIAGGGLIQVKTPEMAAAVVDPKVRGAMVLDDVLGDKPFDFLVVYSSLQTVLADFGQADYTGANAFLDAFAQRRTARGRLTLAIDWDNWREVGIAVDTEVPAHLREWREELLDKAIAPQEGVELFRRLAGHRHSRVVVSTQDLPERIELSREFTGRTILEALGSADAAGLAGGDGAVVSTTASFSSAAELEQRIAEIWRRVLDVDAVGIHDNFFDLGGDSLTGMQLVSELRRELGVELSPVTLYEAPTVSALVRLVRPDAGAAPAVSAAPAAAAETAERDAVAIVGMACRFPGADGVDAFWHNLRQGVESISFWSVEELEAAGIDPALLDDPSYVRARPVMAAAEDFDAGLFGYSPREAQLMDPQHRVFLECAWEALEDAGYDPERYSGSIGAFGGASINTYLFNLYSNPEALDSTDPMQTIIGNEKDSLTTSVSYKLNLKGPGVTVQTFCSTSLVAAHLARNSLLAGECDLALVGAVSVAVPQASGYHFQEDGILSPDGHCRPFDAEARGTVFGNGVGIVVLKRLRDAVAAADTIHAVIRGSAINNDGSLKVGYTAPSVEGQAEVIAAALADAGVGADSIDYLEAHGTGTVLGDPIEVTALTRAYRAHTEDRGYCALGSVKGNVGHLDRAAGVASLIKAVLALDHREIPPAVNFTAPNPKIDFASSPFFVNAELREWQAREGPRRAGVSALGFGGTNAHLILEEAPAAEAVSESRPWQLLLLSARTATALEAATARLADTLDADPEVPLADVAHTLQVGRRELGHRRAVACRTGEAAAALRALDPGRVFSAIHEPGHRPVVFLFPGQGAQYAGMGRELYETEATFRREVDRCCELLEPQLGVDLREVIPLGSAAHGRTRRSAPTATVLEQTAITQPALFVVEYALAQLWMEWGVRPEAMVGHSIGEYVAACLAGVFSLEDALAVVAERGRLIQELPGGEMLSLALAEEELEARFPEGLPGDVALAAVNAPGRLVVSGPAEAIAHLAERPELDGVETRRLHTSHAFHSEMLEPAVEPFTRVVAGVTRNAPRLPFISCVSGGWIEESEATDPAYWARQLRRPVRFSAGAEEILRQGSRVLIEIGPGTTLSNLVRRHPQARERTVVAAMRHPRDERSETAVALESLGKLWLAGVAIDWPGFYRHERRRRIPLPGYPFERQRYWIDAAEPAAAAGGLAAGRRPEQWLFGPSWKRSRLPRPGTPRQPGD